MAVLVKRESIGKSAIGVAEERINDAFGPGSVLIGRQLENGAIAQNDASSSGGAIKISSRVEDHSSARLLCVGAAEETVEGTLGPGAILVWGELEDGSAAGVVADAQIASRDRCAVEIAGCVKDERTRGAGAVCTAGEFVEDGLLQLTVTAARQLEYRSAKWSAEPAFTQAPTGGRTVEITGTVSNQSAIGL